MADSGAAATSALSAAVTAMATAAPDSPGNCDGGNDYNGMMGLRISAIFVILVGSMFGQSPYCRIHSPSNTIKGLYFQLLPNDIKAFEYLHGLFSLQNSLARGLSSPQLLYM